MKIQIKITNLEITIDTDEQAAAPAVVESTIQALQAAVQPKLAKPRKVRTVEAAPTQPEPATPMTVVEPTPVATNGHDAGAPNKPQRMDFHEFDTLVRAEMARLAPEPGVMPSSSAWDMGRNAGLPTWNTVLNRHGCFSTKSLAEKLGLRQARPKPEAA